MSEQSATITAEDFALPIDLGQVEYVIKHPVTGAATSATLTLAGPTHPIRKAAMFSRMRTMLAGGGPQTVALEDADEDETAYVALCTLGWSRLAPSGVPLPFAIGAAQVLYSDPAYRWLRDQARDALRERDLFIGACATA